MTEPTIPSQEEIEELKREVLSAESADHHRIEPPRWVKVVIGILLTAVLILGVVLAITVSILSRQEVRDEAQEKRDLCDGTYTANITVAGAEARAVGAEIDALLLRGLLVFVPETGEFVIPDDLPSFEIDRIVRVLQESERVIKKDIQANIDRAEWRAAGQPTPCPVTHDTFELEIDLSTIEELTPSTAD